MGVNGHLTFVTKTADIRRPRYDRVENWLLRLIESEYWTLMIFWREDVMQMKMQTHGCNVLCILMPY